MLITLTQTLPKETTVNLKLYLHDRALADAPAGLAADTNIIIPAMTASTQVALEVDPTATQIGKTADKMVQPSYYLTCQSEQWQTQDASNGVGAPYFDVHVPGQLAIKLGRKGQVA